MTAHMNMALLAKASWRISNKDQGLWADMMRKKSLKGSSCFYSTAGVPTYTSHAWKGICNGAEALKLGLK